MCMNKWPIEIINDGNKILNNIFNKENNITPSKENVLKFLKMNPHEIKVVILGQDPYPRRGVANGRAFAVSLDTPIPMSLKNIFSEVKEIQGTIITNETLQHWEDNGVLMLNTSLTTNVGESNAHKKYWGKYTQSIIEFLDATINPLFVLWGRQAQSYESMIKNSKISKDFHPSPFSNHLRDGKSMKDIISILEIQL